MTEMGATAQIVLKHGAGVDSEQMISVRTPMHIVPLLNVLSPADKDLVLGAQLLAGHIIMIGTCSVAEQIHEFPVDRL